MLWFHVKQQVQDNTAANADMLLTPDQVRQALPWMGALLDIDPWVSVTAVFDEGKTTVTVTPFEG